MTNSNIFAILVINVGDMLIPIRIRGIMFKVGDTVRIVSAEGEDEEYKENIGCTGVIQSLKHNAFPSNGYAHISHEDLVNKAWCRPFIKNLELVEDTMKYKQGDILVDDFGKRKVLGVSGLVYHMSELNRLYVCGEPFTQEELDDHGYELYQEEDDQFEEAKKLLQENGYKIVKE